jgi:hypothetical protein
VSATERGAGHRVAPGVTDAEALLRRALDLVAGARPMPLSASVMVNRDEVAELLEQAVGRLPDELRAARWLLKERDEFLDRMQAEGEEILDSARVRAERMVQRAEVVRTAQQTARRTVEVAAAEARRLTHEAEDYCDQRLAEFEVVLDRLQRSVQAGRAKLQSTPSGCERDDAAGAVPMPGERDEGFFDQDRER